MYDDLHSRFPAATEDSHDRSHRSRGPRRHRPVVQLVQYRQPRRRQSRSGKLTEDYESCAGYLPGECWGRETSIKVVSNFATTIPDMKFDVKEVLVAGDRVIVRGEVTGTPAGDLFGVPHSGKSFRIMAVDIQTIRDGKIARTFHMENWLSAIGQLRAK
jgi:ketosteroid isomerase-like protein